MVDTTVYTVVGGVSSTGVYENRVEHISEPDAKERCWLPQIKGSIKGSNLELSIWPGILIWIYKDLFMGRDLGWL